MTADRLLAMMTLRGTVFRDNLAAAARKAGEQLEWWKPVALIPNPRTRLHAGSIVPVDPGTVLIVLADARRVLTIRLRPLPSHVARRAMIDDLADMSSNNYPLDDGEIIAVIAAAVEEWGGQPGTQTGGMPDDAMLTLFALLFSAIPADRRQSLFDVLEDMIDRGVCPAMVGLAGKATTRGLCGIWPLVLPLAQYLDSVERALGTRP
jgi:hypothetical protein